MGTYLIRAPLPLIDQIEATVKGYSAALEVDLPELTDDQRDVMAVLMLMTPSSDQRPDAAYPAPVVHYYLHSYTGADHEGIQRLEGHGPLTDQWVRDTLGPTATFKIQPVLDLAGQAPVDAYEIPDRHRQAVQLMTPADVFPWGSSTDRTTQIDHTIAYDDTGPAGQSRIGNYSPLTVTHHRIKTHGRWEVQQPFPGIYLWQDPHGHTYVVDHTGTRRLPGTPPEPVVVEIYRQMPSITYDAALQEPDS